MNRIRRRILNRMRPGEDIGLDYGGQKGRQRSINADGSYNLERITGSMFGNFTLYHWLITTNWTRFWLVAFGFYGVMNLIFASIYYSLGIHSLNNLDGMDSVSRFLYCFFFSVQSFTTVGYGELHPVGLTSNFVATIEAFLGLMTFALATGTLYGRFSKPTHRIKYSKNIVISPFKDITALQFIIANQLQSPLIEMEARVNISWLEEGEDGKPLRKFQQAKLEVDKISMFPTSWTINHPIDDESALFGKTMEEIQRADVEVFVLLKGFEETFSQTIYSRQSYTANQFIYGAKFRRPFFVNEKGKLVMDLTKLGDYDKIIVNIPHLVE
ncbi:MAG TPA: potassium channel family protein [Chitinophagales bacterium]|nr:potassium channel family protein [Chitinophagales bacterium]